MALLCDGYRLLVNPWLRKTGDTMLGKLTLFRRTPVDALEAASKGYVDDTVGGINLTEWPADVRRLYQWQVTNEATGVENIGTAATMTVTGTASLVGDDTGRYDNRVNAGGASSVCGWLNTSPPTRRQFLPDITWIIKTGPNATDLTNCRIWCMMLDSASDQAVAIPANAFGFRFNPQDASDTQWQAFCALDASNASVVSTGLTPTVDTRYVFRARWTDLNTLKLYAQGSLISTVTNTGVMVAKTTPMFAQTRLVNATAVARNLRTSKIMVLSY